MTLINLLPASDALNALIFVLLFLLQASKLVNMSSATLCLSLLSTGKQSLYGPISESG